VTERELLLRAAGLAGDWLEGLDERPVVPPVDARALRRALGGPLPEAGEAPEAVIERLAAGAEPGLAATPGPRFFGFVTGGSLPAALAADWLTAAWDQNGLSFSPFAAANVAEEVAAEWALDLLGLPAGASVGFVTGGSMANATCLAAARGEVLRRAGWDVEADGLVGAPPIRVVAGEEAHITVFAALRLLGLGAARVVRVAADGQGSMRGDALRRALGGSSGPTIVCAQAGNVNTGAFDPIDEIADLCGADATWLHVDGAFGLWAAASPATRPLVRGFERADSWAVDAHKWLNVPYDSGLAITAHPAAHRAVTGMAAAYLPDGGADRSGYDWTPEASRRARGFAVWAALRSLGREGVADLVERACALARRAAGGLADEPGVEVLNDVVLNQVLVRFHGPAGPDATTRAVVEDVQRGGVCWLGGTVWHEMAAMRLSVSSWRTTEADVDLAVEAILRARRGAAAPA